MNIQILGTLKCQDTKKAQIIIWLYGAGGAGTDNVRQISGDQVPGARIWTNPEIQTKYPVFILVPQISAELILRA